MSWRSTSISRRCGRLRAIDDWQCGHVAAVVTGRADAARGDEAHRFEWASVSKLATALATLVAAEEGIVDLDEPAGPPGRPSATFWRMHQGCPSIRPADLPAGPSAHLLNYGFDVAAALVAERAEMAFPTYFAHVWAGTGMSLEGSAGSGVSGTIADLAVLARSSRRRSESLPRRSPRRRQCSSRASTECCPASAARTRTTGGSASSCETGSRRTGPARSTRAAFGPSDGAARSFGSTRRPGSRSASSRPRRFGNWAVDAWPALSDAVLRELSVG